MKTILLFFGMLALTGCSADEFNAADNTQQHNGANETARMSQTPKNLAPSQNKVLLLKVDYLTQVFEGGKQLAFNNNPDFNMIWNYQAPADFGSVTMIYSEVGQPIFEGTIHWMGLGHMQYPQSLLPAASFATTAALSMPGNDAFLILNYAEADYYPSPVPLTQIWDAVKNLQLVSQYRSSNPNAPVRLFLYTPSVGVGNPADWDYFVILKN